MRGRSIGLGVVLLLGCQTTSIGGEDEASSASTSKTSETSTSEGFDASEDEEPMTCGGFSLVSEPKIPPQVMLVVDASSSMATLWDHDGDGSSPMVTRASTVRGLLELLAPELESRVDFGLQRFPTAGSEACEIAPAPELLPAPAQAQAILAALSLDASELVGGSPASTAFVAARDHLLAQRGEAYAALVLITDGGANCGEGLGPNEIFSTPDDALLAAIDEAHVELGMPTIVIGVDALGPSAQEWPGVDASARLDELALAGGYAPTYFDASDPESILEALDPCTLGCDNPSPACEVDLTMTPEGAPDPSQAVTITSEGALVPLVEDCANEDGWAWIVDHEIFELCGSWCDALIEDYADFEGSYACPPI